LGRDSQCRPPAAGADFQLTARIPSSHTLEMKNLILICDAFTEMVWVSHSVASLQVSIAIHEIESL